MKKKKDSPPSKDLGGGKWHINIDYSRQRSIDSPIAVTNSKSAAKEKEILKKTLRSQIKSAQLSKYTLTKNLSALRNKEAHFFDSSKDLPEFYRLKNSIKRTELKLKKTERHLLFLNQQLTNHSLPSEKAPSTRPVSLPTSSSSISPSSISTVQSVFYPSINVGDYCYHNSYGNGIIFFKTDSSCRILFADSLSKTFSYQDPVFKGKTLIIKNAWDRTHGKYTIPFHYSTDSIPSSLQNAYATFIENQGKDLCAFISKLRLYTQKYANNYSSNFYAQSALDCIYNIEHGPQVFLSLQNKITPPVQKQTAPVPAKKAAPVPASPAFVSAKPSLSPPALSIKYKPSTDTLYVYNGHIKCIRDKHNMVCANAHTETASGETAVLNVNCCLNCNRFYISYDEYARYMEKYKSLLTRIVLVDENGNSTFVNSLAVESTLKLCGYSVSQEKGFTSKERATLLAHIIHNGIVSKPDVIQHLNWLIRMNGKKAGNAIAKEKWEEDLAFVRNLDTATQANHTIRSVAPYPSARKNRR